MLYVKLNDEQRAELQQVCRTAVGRVALRAHMVLLSDREFSVPQIATIYHCEEDVVRLWLHRYQRAGVPGLLDRPRTGRPPKDVLSVEVVSAQANQSPRCSGLVQSCWTVTLLQAFLRLRFCLDLSRSTVRRCLKADGWRWARPRLAPASTLPKKRDPETDSKMAAIAEATSLAARGLARVLFLDECDLHLLPVIRSMWMRGPRVRVPTPGKNEKRAFFGALDAASGAWHWATRDRKLAVHLVAFLQQLSEAYPQGRLILVMDNVPTHSAKVVKSWLGMNPRVEVLWLPKYAAHDANPAERIWGLMKDAVAANRLSGSIDELVASAVRFFARNLSPHPVIMPMAA